MIRSLLICNNSGFPFYANLESNSDYDPSLFSGLISAISMLGKELFQEEIATINFGVNSKSSIVILSRDFFGSDKKIFFVFLCENGIDHKKIKQFTSLVLMETKNSLKIDSPVDDEATTKKIDKIVKSTGILELGER